MVKEIPGNKKKYKNNDSSDSGLICKHCSDGFIMIQSHCRVEGAEGGSGPEGYQGLRHVLQEVARGESQAGEGKWLWRQHCTTPVGARRLLSMSMP